MADRDKAEAGPVADFQQTTPDRGLNHRVERGGDLIRDQHAGPGQNHA